MKLARTDQAGEPINRHVLGGRVFLEVGNSTLEQDLTIRPLIRKAGLDDAVLHEGEEPGAFALRVLDTALESRAVLQLLGCLLVPEELATSSEPGMSWTPEIGQETARFLGDLTTQDDKAQVRQLIQTLISAFFENGITSLWNSKTS